MSAKNNQENHVSWKLWMREKDRRYLPHQVQIEFSFDSESANSGRLITGYLPSSDHSAFFVHLREKMLLARYYPLEGVDSVGEHGALILNNECYPGGLALVSNMNVPPVFQKTGKTYSSQRGLECIPIIGLQGSSFLTRFFNTHHHVLVKKPHFWSEGRVMLYARSEDEPQLRSVASIQRAPLHLWKYL